MCNKVIDTCFLLFDSVPDRYKIPKICEEAVDICLAALKFIPDWFVTRKMLEKVS